MKIELKPPTAELIEALPKWAQKPELHEYFRAWPPVQDWNRPDIIAARLENTFGIYEDDKLVGVCQLCYNNGIAKTIEMGMLVDKDLTKSRWEVSDEAHRQMVDYLFNRFDYQKIYVRILTTRTKLRERFEAGGYIVEGHLKRSARINGEWQDEFLLAYFKPRR